MITSITVENFKSLKKVDLKLGNFNLFIGTNASGKSNFFDALRVLQGIGYGLTIDEVFNGKPKGSGNEVWDGIRGGSRKAYFLPRNKEELLEKEPLIKFSVTFKNAENDILNIFRYFISILVNKSNVNEEKLFIDDQLLFNSKFIKESEKIVTYYSGKEQKNLFVDDETTDVILWKYLDKIFPGFPQILVFSKEDLDKLKILRNILNNIQHFDLYPPILRHYSQASKVDRIGEKGENFAALVNTILADKKSKEAYISWLKELTPTEIDDVCILEGALGEPLFAIKDGDNIYPAPILSDGTLRFAALAAAFFQPNMPSIITIEEIETGIHANRLRLLVELLKNQSKNSLVQIMATTHSERVLDWLTPEDYPTTFICKRDEETGETRILPLSEIPQLLELTSKYSLGELFAEGWFEGGII